MCGIYRSSKVFKLVQNGCPLPKSPQPLISIISIHLFLVAVDKTRYRISLIKHFALVFKVFFTEIRLFQNPTSAPRTKLVLRAYNRPGSFNNRFRNCVAQFCMNRENYNLTPTNFKVNRRDIEQKSLSLLLTSKQSTSYFRKRKVKMKECEGDRRSSPILVINELVPRATRLNLYHVIKKRRALGTRMKFPVPPLG